jgi:phage/plasmid-associated DNA primase
VGSTSLYNDYRSWADEQGIGRPLTQKHFIQRLQVRYHLQPGRDKHQRYVEGLALRNVYGENVIGLRGRRETATNDGW